MMKVQIEKILQDFLLQQADFSRPILIGLSGGPDSLALFHCLISLNVWNRELIHIAHVDHRWRQESLEEAEELKKLAFTEKVHFHCKILNPKLLKGI